jgi:hypothetical protein
MRATNRPAASAALAFVGALVLTACTIAGPARDEVTASRPPPVIQEQGSFAVGGTVVRSPGTCDPTRPGPEGQTLHGDHARVFYQVPANPRKLPLVMWHGFVQFGKTWEATADGREGFQTLFLRRRFPVYLIDQPRRGGAARSTVAGTIAATPDDQRWFNMFRLGRRSEFFPGVQFSSGPEALNRWRVAQAPRLRIEQVQIGVHLAGERPLERAELQPAAKGLARRRGLTRTRDAATAQIPVRTSVRILCESNANQRQFQAV